MQQLRGHIVWLIVGCALAVGILVGVTAFAPRGTGTASPNSAGATSSSSASATPSTNPGTQSKGTLKGLVEASPTCPVERAEQPCAAKPVPDRVVMIETPDGAVVTKATTDQQGQFVVQLAPGTYTLQVVPGAAPYPIQRNSQSVTIEAGQTVQVTIELDTGIR